MSSLLQSNQQQAGRGGSAEMSGGLTLLFAIAVGVVVLSLFASQPLIGLIGPSFGLNASAASLVTTLTLLGYASGLFLLVPLTDLAENRTVIVTTLAIDVVALAAVACAPTPSLFLLACFVAGVTTSAIQMLVPVAALLTPEARRGRVIGNVMSGLMIGILLSRPTASLVAEFAGWRWLYGALAGLIAALTLILMFVIPRRYPPTSTSYPRLIGSMWSTCERNPSCSGAHCIRRCAWARSACSGRRWRFGLPRRRSPLPRAVSRCLLWPVPPALLSRRSRGAPATVAGHAQQRSWPTSP